MRVPLTTYTNEEVRALEAQLTLAEFQLESLKGPSLRREGGGPGSPSTTQGTRPYEWPPFSFASIRFEPSRTLRQELHRGPLPLMFGL